MQESALSAFIISQLCSQWTRLPEYKLVVEKVKFRGGLKAYGTHQLISRLFYLRENFPSKLVQAENEPLYFT